MQEFRAPADIVREAPRWLGEVYLIPRKMANTTDQLAFCLFWRVRSQTLARTRLPGAGRLQRQPPLTPTAFCGSSFRGGAGGAGRSPPSPRSPWLRASPCNPLGGPCCCPNHSCLASLVSPKFCGPCSLTMLQSGASSPSLLLISQPRH